MVWDNSPPHVGNRVKNLSKGGMIWGAEILFLRIHSPLSISQYVPKMVNKDTESLVRLNQIYKLFSGERGKNIPCFWYMGMCQFPGYTFCPESFSWEINKNVRLKGSVQSRKQQNQPYYYESRKINILIWKVTELNVRQFLKFRVPNCGIIVSLLAQTSQAQLSFLAHFQK